MGFYSLYFSTIKVDFGMMNLSRFPRENDFYCLLIRMDQDWNSFSIGNPTQKTELDRNLIHLL